MRATDVKGETKKRWTSRARPHMGDAPASRFGKAVAGGGIRLLIPETGVAAMAIISCCEAPARLDIVLDEIFAVLTVLFLEFFQIYHPYALLYIK